jgi:hypothetical protein
MPFIKFITSKRRILLTISISLNREIMSLCSYCIKKELVYITLVSPSRHQPFSYLECIKANTQLSYNIHSIPLNKYTCFTAHY